MQTRDIAVSWLNSISLCSFDISSNSEKELTIRTESDARKVLVEVEDFSCYNFLSVTAVAAFSWVGAIPAIRDTFYRLLPYISVKKWGWLYTTEYDIILKVVHDAESDLCFTVAYKTAVLQQQHFIRFIENCCKISVKRDTISLLIPTMNPLLSDAVIRTAEDFARNGENHDYEQKELRERRSHGCKRLSQQDRFNKLFFV